MCALLSSTPDLPGPISINVSAVQLARHDWPSCFAQTMVGHGVEATRVVVEVTETAVLALSPEAHAGSATCALTPAGKCTGFFAHVDEVFSTYRPLSEVTFHRSGLERPGPQSEDFEEVMLACRALKSATGGAFDPWSVPGGYDPSGYVKGWAAGRASDRLHSAGFVDHLINAGGDISARGDESPGSGQGWPVGILNPHEPTQVVEVVALREQGMATSGRYERGDHVVVPATRRPAVGVDSVTVVGPDPGTADAVASAGLVDGLAAMRWFVDLGQEWSLHVVIGETSHVYGPAFGESFTSP